MIAPEVKAELNRIERLRAQPFPYLQLDVLPAAPTNPARGMVVCSDGSWTAAAGPYWYNGTTWVQL